MIYKLVVVIEFDFFLNYVEIIVIFVPITYDYFENEIMIALMITGYPL